MLQSKPVYQSCFCNRGQKTLEIGGLVSFHHKIPWYRWMNQGEIVEELWYIALTGAHAHWSPQLHSTSPAPKDGAVSYKISHVSCSQSNTLLSAVDYFVYGLNVLTDVVMVVKAQLTTSIFQESRWYLHERVEESDSCRPQMIDVFRRLFYKQEWIRLLWRCV